ncbi:MAG: fibrobacter succinogenes major paralogous domain-containing protein [Fibromonadaceae bacterium]|jgi:uncharacterized protein (TIGR02145 family)|nr:fibrobacter succinogenes major paralogous domain-containing protein [Fibromonadaceae bacterium]
MKNIIVRAGSACPIAKLALTAILALAITFTLTACEEKKKQDGTDTKPPETASETEAAETIATEDGPKFLECGVLDTDAEEAKWRMGVANDSCTRLVAIGSGSSKKYTRAVNGSQMHKIKYIGEKKERREPRDMEFYFDNYETSCGLEYEIIDYKEKECVRNFFLYNDSEKWGGVPDNIVFKNEKKYPRLKASKDEIVAMEKLQNGRKIILTEVIADFSIEGNSNRLMLARYKNSKKDGLFQIVLRDHNNDYFTADFPSGLDENGQPNWRADMGDEIGSWSLYFVGRVAEGLFLITDWCAAEGCGITPFVAKNGKLEDWQDKNLADSRDNKTYKTVKIGEQVWMAENLNFEAKEGSMCYDNKPDNCNKYGRLYDWNTAMKACPNGWHLPSDKEWQTLVDFAGGVKVAGKKLKATSGWDNNGNGTDDFGFSALPGGSYLCRDGCDFYNGGIGGDWWNSSIRDDDYMYIGEPDNPDKENGASYSVRCIKD